GQGVDNRWNLLDISTTIAVRIEQIKEPITQERFDRVKGNLPTTRFWNVPPGYFGQLLTYFLCREFEIRTQCILAHQLPPSVHRFSKSGQRSYNVVSLLIIQDMQGLDSLLL